MKINKHLLTGILAAIVIIVILLYFNTNGTVTLFPKVEELKKENEILNNKLQAQKKITDSLLQATEVLTVKWNNRDTMMRTNIKIKYYEKINNINTLDDDSTVLLLADWLSEIDSLQR